MQNQDGNSGIGLGETTSQMHRDVESKEDNEDMCKKLAKKQYEICCNLRQETLFDTIGREFHFGVFVRQMTAHLFLPLYFTLPNQYGQGVRLTGPSIFFNIVLPCVFYGMIVFFVCLSNHDKSLVGFSIWWPFLSYVAHRSLVSLKYATLSPTEYKRFCECKDNKLSASYLDQMMLLKGWFELVPAVLYFELGAASTRIGEKINEIHLLVPSETYNEVSASQVRYWNAFLRGHDIIDSESAPCPEMQRLPSGDYAISVYDIALAVIRRCNPHRLFEDWATRLASVLTMIIILVSFRPFYVENNPDSPGLVAMYMICSTIMNYIFGRLMFLFLMFVLYDVLRLRQMVKVMHCMVRPSDVTLGFSLSLKAKVTESALQLARTRTEAIVDINQRAPWKGSISLSHPDYAALPLRPTEAGSSPRESKPIVAGQPIDISTASIDPTATVTTATMLTQSGKQKLIRGSRVLGEKLADHGAESLIPRVDFRYPENILAWAYLRITIQAFGDRFRYRTDMYAAFTLGVMLVLMVLALTWLILAHDPREEFESVYVLESMIAVTILVIFLLLISWGGAMVNEELELQNRTLASRVLKMRSRLVFREERSVEELEGADNLDRELLDKQIECCDAVMEVCDVNNRLRPFKFLGMTAQSALTSAIATAALSFYSVIFSIYFSGGGTSAVSML